jgi:hypothetical protein
MNPSRWKSASSLSYRQSKVHGTAAHTVSSPNRIMSSLLVGCSEHLHHLHFERIHCHPLHDGVCSYDNHVAGNIV